ncbi:MAG: TatD family hydrolase [bacterium]|nr:TatD family hydrolase [bacterium]
MDGALDENFRFQNPASRGFYFFTLLLYHGITVTYTYFDIHSHLNDKRYADDLSEVLTRMREHGVASIVVGTDHEMSERAIALAEKYDDLWATIGQHPTDKHEESFGDAWYLEHAKHPRVVAIGECGLDYYWPEIRSRQRSEKIQGLAFPKLPLRPDLVFSPDLEISAASDTTQEKHRQHDLFERQIVIAEKVGKPLMVHGRPTKGTMDAYEDILAILKNHPGIRGNIHFFVGNVDVAKQFLDLGLTMSFTGVLTFTHDYDEVVKYLPLDRIMSETDAPYVSPTPHRGKRNEPAFVVETVKAIARIRGEDEGSVRDALVANAKNAFRLRSF